MNQSIYCQLLTELPMHLLVFSCGAFGYVATRWVRDRIVQPRLARRPRGVPREACREVEEVACSAALEVSIAAEAVCAPAAVAASVPRQRIKPQPLELALAEASEAPKAVDDEACALEEDVVEVTQEVLGDRDLMPEMPLPDRVVRLLAKKAERKARKAREQSAKEAKEPTVNVEPFLAEDTYEAPCVVLQESLCQLNEAEQAEPTEQNEDCEPTLVFSKRTTVSTDAAELSTADEGQFSSWDDLETDGSWEGEDLLEFLEEWKRSSFTIDVPTGGSSHTPVTMHNGMGYVQPTSDQHCWGYHDSDDGWMLPFDEILQRRSSSMQITYEPVFSADGSQLFTHGEQFYVMGARESGVSTEPAAMGQLSPDSASVMNYFGVAGHAYACGEQEWGACWGQQV